MTQITANGKAYSDDGTTPRDMNNGGFRNHLLPMLGDVLLDAGFYMQSAINARVDAQAAAASAANAPGTRGTSPTSMTIRYDGVHQWFDIPNEKMFALGQTLVLASTASPSNWMAGEVVFCRFYPGNGAGAYPAGYTNVAIAPRYCQGAGTFADWTVSLSGPGAGTGLINELRHGPSISAVNGVLDLNNVAGNFVFLGGTAQSIHTINLKKGAERLIYVGGVAAGQYDSIVHDVSKMYLPGRGNILTEVDDLFVVRAWENNCVMIHSYTRSTGAPVTYRNGHMPRTINSVAGVDLNCSLGNEFAKNVAGNTAFTFSNVPAGRYTLTLEVEHASGIISFPASVRPKGGSIPTLTAGKRHYFMLTTANQGVSWGLTVSNNH